MQCVITLSSPDHYIKPVMQCVITLSSPDHYITPAMECVITLLDLYYYIIHVGLRYILFIIIYVTCWIRLVNSYQSILYLL